MGRHCRLVEEWITEKVEQRIERWLQRNEERCQRQPWWSPARWVCRLVTVVVAWVQLIFVSIPKRILRTVCEIVHAPVTLVTSEVEATLCAAGLSTRRVRPFDTADALLFAKVCERAYDDEQTTADFAATAPGLRVIGGMIRYVPSTEPAFPSDPQAYVLGEEESDRLVVAFRGTQPLVLLEWVTNFTAAPLPFPETVGLVHAGFFGAYQAVRSAIFLTVAREMIAREDTAHPVRRLVFTATVWEARLPRWRPSTSGAGCARRWRFRATRTARPAWATS